MPGGMLVRPHVIKQLYTLFFPAGFYTYNASVNSTSVTSNGLLSLVEKVEDLEFDKAS